MRLKAVAIMDANYDEFGNYIGPDLVDSDEELSVENDL